MGYPNFGKVKTIVLPTPDENLSYEQYKEKFGIDLKDIVKIASNGLIILKPQNVFWLINDVDAHWETPSRLYTIISAYTSGYESGVSDGSLRIYFGGVPESSGIYLDIRCSKDKTLAIENFTVTTLED